ncbi:hypothetical protein TNCV_2514051 [Trichonephila clavipes]|nr:hypothetical protein TNCV_2514051 [Trichonephila clavipes]
MRAFGDGHVAGVPGGQGIESCVRALVPQKFSVEEELMRRGQKTRRGQKSSRWCDVEVWKGSYQLRYRPRHLNRGSKLRSRSSVATVLT